MEKKAVPWNWLVKLLGASKPTWGGVGKAMAGHGAGMGLWTLGAMPVDAMFSSGQAAARAVPQAASRMGPGLSGALGMNVTASAEPARRLAFEVGVEKFCKEAGMKKEAILPLLAGILGASAPTWGALGAAAAKTTASGALMSGGMNLFTKFLERGSKAAPQMGRAVGGAAGYYPRALSTGYTPNYGYMPQYMTRHASASNDKRLAFEAGVEKFCKEAGMDAEDTADMFRLVKQAYTSPLRAQQELTFGLMPDQTGGERSPMSNPNMSSPMDRSFEQGGSEYGQSELEWQDLTEQFGLGRGLGSAMAGGINMFTNPINTASALFTTAGRKGYQKPQVERAMAANVTSADKSFNDYLATSGMSYDEQMQALVKRKTDRADVEREKMWKLTIPDLVARAKDAIGSSDPQAQARWVDAQMPNADIHDIRRFMNISGPPGGSAIAGGPPAANTAGRQPTPPVVPPSPPSVPPVAGVPGRQPTPPVASPKPPGGGNVAAVKDVSGSGAKGNIGPVNTVKEVPGARKEPSI